MHAFLSQSVYQCSLLHMPQSLPPGTAGWGISWYMNGMLIPNITVYRGTTYTFTVEGGSDPTNPAQYHPFYITSSSSGGYLGKSDADKMVYYTNQ